MSGGIARERGLEPEQIPEGVLICRISKRLWLVFPRFLKTRERHYVFGVDSADDAWVALRNGPLG